MLCHIGNEAAVARLVEESWIKTAFATHAYVIGQAFCETLVGRPLTCPLAKTFAMRQLLNQLSRDDAKEVL